MSILTQQALEALYNSSGSGTFATNSSNNIGSASLRAFAKDVSDTLFALQNNNPDVSYIQSSDFITTASDFTSIVSGAGAAVGGSTFGIDNVEHALGVISAQTGTTAAGYAYYTNYAASQIKFGFGHSISLKFRVAVEALSDGTNTFTLYLGFGDNLAGAEHSNGCYFKYTHGTNAGKYQCVTAIGASRTATDSGVAQTTLFKTFEIVIAADASSVVFKIDGALVATNTTNIPTATTQFTIAIVKSFGAASRFMDIDWYNLSVTRTTAR